MLTHRTAGRVAVVPTEPDCDMLQDGYEAAKLVRRGGVSGMTIDAQIRCQTAKEAAAYAAMLIAADPSLTADVEALVAAARAAAKTFRWYEELHAAKGPEHQHKTERNRAEAEKLEAALANWTETNDATG